MQCTCGFENGPDAKFCGKCGLALGAGNATPDVAQAVAPVSAATGGRKPRRLGMPRLLLTVLALAAVAAAGGYWWLNQSRPLTPSDAQRMLDEWVSKRAEGAGDHRLVFLKQAWLDSVVRRQEALGNQITDAQYTQLEARAMTLTAVRVIGVQELPTQNAAIAELDMGSLPPGKARFVHYSDGRWVLEAVEWEGVSLQDRPNFTGR